MSKFKSSILILGLVVVFIAASLATFLVLAYSDVLVTEKIAIECAVVSAEKTYDGTPLVPNEYTLGGEPLTKGHHEIVTLSGSQTDAGESKSTATVRIVDEKGYDVTKDYSIKITDGRLKVTTQAIVVGMGDATAVYSGSKIIFDDYVLLSGKLAEGHHIGAKFAGAGGVSVGPLDSAKLLPAIYDASGNDVTANYSLRDFQMGKVEILPRPITFMPTEIRQVYDGKVPELTSYTIQSGSLVAGHYAVVKMEYVESDANTVMNVGTHITRIQTANIYTAEGVDVTANYEMTGATSSVTITPRPLTVVGKSATWDYTGTPRDLGNQAEMQLGLVDGEKVEVVYSPSVFTEAKDYSAELRMQVSVKKVDDTESRNYEITTIIGKVEILPKTVNVKIRNYSAEFSGEDITDATLSSLISCDAPFKASYFDPDRLEAESFIEVGSYPLSAKLKLEIPGLSLIEQNNLSKNYKLNIDTGFVEITRKTITVELHDYIKEYKQGEKLKSSDEVVKNLLFIGEKMQNKDGEIISFEESDFSAQFYRERPTEAMSEIEESGQYYLNIIPNNSNSEKFKNFNYTFKPSIITIKPCDITASMRYSSKEYDKSVVTDEDMRAYLDINTDFIKVDDFKFNFSRYNSETSQFEAMTTYPKDVGTYRVEPEYRGASLQLKNYNLVYSANTFVINKKSVMAWIKSGTKEYSGNEIAPQAEEFADCEDESFAKDVFEVVSLNGTVLEVGTYELTIKFADETLEANYALDVTPGTLTVLSRTVKVRIDGFKTEYDGMPVDIGSLSAYSSEVAEDVQLEISSCSAVDAVDAGTYTYTAEITFSDSDGNDVSRNYNAVIENPTFTIKPLAVTLEVTGEFSKVYDGLPFELNLNDAGFTFNGSVPAGISLSVKSIDYTKIVKVLVPIAEEGGETGGDTGDGTGGETGDTGEGGEGTGSETDWKNGMPQPLEFSNAVVVDAVTGKEVTGNYEITYSSLATVAIKKRTVILTVDDYILVLPSGTTAPARLDVSNLSNLAHISAATPLATGDYFDYLGVLSRTLDSAPTSTPSAQYELSADYEKIYNSQGEDVTDCYDINEDDIGYGIILRQGSSGSTGSEP